jgi:hypothetical protein
MPQLQVRVDALRCCNTWSRSHGIHVRQMLGMAEMNAFTRFLPCCTFHNTWFLVLRAAMALMCATCGA